MEGLRTICWFCHGAPHSSVATSVLVCSRTSSSSPGVIWVPQPSSPQAQKEIPDTSHSAFSLVLLGDNRGTEFPAEILPGEDEAGGGVTPEDRLQEAHRGAGRGVREGTCCGVLTQSQGWDSDGPWQGGAGTRGAHRTAEGGSKACPGEVLWSLGHK